MAGKRSNSDLKYKFIRGLQRQEVYQRSKHWLKSAAEWTSRAIVSLELCERPVKSVKHAERLEGIGDEIKKKLEKIKDDDYQNANPPVPGKFVTSAAAILVAALDATELAYKEGHSKDSSVMVPEEVVKNRAKTMCEEEFLDTVKDGDISICPAWWRIEVLIKRGLIKRRIFNKEPVYLLLPSGSEEALKLRERSGTVPAESKSSIPWKTLPANDEPLYTNYDGSDGLLLLVDISEMGGDRVGLGDLCRLIEDMNIKYRTQKLPVGDYSWEWHSNDVKRILPFLVERKRADDVARTLKEGRFWNQVTKMVDWKSQFTTQGLQCQLQYIIEGKPEQYMVKCMDGCQGVGMCGNPTVIQVKNALKDLTSHPDICVQYTENLQDTVVMVSSITAELEMRIKKGDFDEMIVKELRSAENKNTRDFYIIDNDDVTIIDEGKNSPDLDLMIKETVYCANIVQHPEKESNSQNGSKTIKSQANYNMTSCSIGSPDQSVIEIDNDNFNECIPKRKSMPFPNVVYIDDEDDNQGYKEGKPVSHNELPLEPLDEDDNQGYKSKEGKPVSYNELPLEPLVQYHCSGVKQTPPKRRATLSKYHVEGAYIPKLDYNRDEDVKQPIGKLSETYIPRIDYKKDSNLNKYVSQINYGHNDLGFQEGFHGNKRTGVRNSLQDDSPRKRPSTLTKNKVMFTNTPLVNETKKNHQPPTKMFKMSYPLNYKAGGSNKGICHGNMGGHRSRDSAISSEEEPTTSNTSTRQKIDAFINRVQSKHHIDSAIDSDGDSLPDVSIDRQKRSFPDLDNDSLPDVSNARPKSSVDNFVNESFPKSVNTVNSAKKGQKCKTAKALTLEQEQHIKTVKGILPHISLCQIQTALERNRWNVDITVAELLDL